MADDIKVSVIVPVYNSAPYLRQCLDSIVGQTLREIEIICVDDGSTDESPAILDEYAAADARLSVLHQQNQYAGVARNNGMAHARGKYLMFWDSDDYFDLTALEKMYDQCEADEADICVCGVKRQYDDIGATIVEPNYIREKCLPEAIPFNRETNEGFILNFATPAVWNKLFRRSFVEGEGLAFSSTKSANDVLFVEVALCCARGITLVCEPLVVYRRDREGSLTNTLSSTAATPIRIWVETAQELERRGIMPRESFANRAFSNLLYILRNQKSYGSFESIMGALDEKSLQQLQLSDASIIRDEWQRSCLEDIQSGSAGAVLVNLMNHSYGQQVRTLAKLRASKEKTRELKKELKAVQRELLRRGSAYSCESKNASARLVSILKSLVSGK